MKVTWGSWWIVAVVAACSGCAPEKLELGDAPLEEGGAGSGGAHSAGGSTPSGGASTPGGSSMGGGGADCVSPTQHPERAYDDGVTFCACDDDDDDQCVDARALGAGYVALICEDGAWVAVNDGPCGVEKTCYSPTQNLEHAYDEGAIGCTCEGEADQCVRTTNDGRPWDVALVCQDGNWQAVEDGPCDGGAACRVNGVDYPSGAKNVPWPYSCNTCDCVSGNLTNCTQYRCADECPAGSYRAERCAECGPAGGCAIFESGCFTDPSCEDGVCSSLCE